MLAPAMGGDGRGGEGCLPGPSVPPAGVGRRRGGASRCRSRVQPRGRTTQEAPLEVILGDRRGV